MIAVDILLQGLDNHAWTVIVDLHFKMGTFVFLASFAS